ncbi:type I secretion C-terminal target domain-containing protein [Sphingobium sp. HBC34]|uniref:Type I secretion C-terminal target domain-containing protein n=1 Tax=Sphingobium cyanobacteriorum TaxID=3063954 RepID=A0ABT8ZQ34_9SPHN|nr:type I secretion C-terminal target domain-containing protein [Sphingobium sp. HBC34]MDO7835870.1 type I secretion C-terminal target domain-containing protein [Sphingobium sp. HBC34]
MAVIKGTSSSETINGTAGVDTILGLAGNDIIFGLDGNDALTGGAGDDILHGGAGNDRFLFDDRGFGIDTIADFATGDRLDLRAFHIGSITQLSPFMRQVGNDVQIDFLWGGRTERIILSNTQIADITASTLLLNSDTDPLSVLGTSNADTLFGGNGNDILSGSGGDDSLVGGAGIDALIGGEGNDMLRGGTGSDRFIFSTRGFGIDTIADYTSGDRIDLRGLNVADISQLAPFMAQAGANVEITLIWGGRTERIIIADSQMADITTSGFLFNTSLERVRAIGTSNDDTLFGGSGDDELTGGSGSDALNGGAGSDVLVGGEGNDMLRGGAGNDRFVYAARGFGLDTIADYTSGDRIDLRGLNIGELSQLAPFMRQAGSNVEINLEWAGRAERITIAGVQLANLTAGNFLFNNDIIGGGVDGTSNDDSLFGSLGPDMLYGYAGDDSLSAGAGDDLLVGGEGSDIMRGGEGNDRFLYTDRGFGTDLIVDFTAGDRIDLRTLNIADMAQLAPFMRQSGNDVHIAFTWAGRSETIIVQDKLVADLTVADFLFNSASDPVLAEGTGNADTVFGGKGNDHVYGDSGNDSLSGGAGRDVLIGGAGLDIIRGGAGADRFLVRTGDSGGSQIDRILDFSSSEGDRLDLRRIDPSDEAGDQLLSFVSGAFTGIGQARIVQTGSSYQVQVNLDSIMSTVEVAVDMISAAPVMVTDLLL